MITRRRRIILCLFPLILGAGAMWAQVGTSRISGSVTDTSGAMIAGAKIAAKNEATGQSFETTSSSAGAYTIEALPPASYTVTVSHPGFQTFASAGNVLSVGAPLVLNATLKVGAMTEVVRVESTAERIETTHAMLSDVVDRKGVTELPLNGRNPLALIVLQPGMVQRSTGAAGSGSHVFGSRDRAHNVTIDGIEANESSVPNPQSNIHRLNPDNVLEYRVVTHNATPEFGRNSGANVAIATRSGTNEFHGDLFWFHRNTVLNANEWFNNAEGIARPTLLLNQFGFNAGGPVRKNKTFFFGSYQGNRIGMTQPISQSFGVPRVYTAAMKSGIFRYFVPDAGNPLVLDGVRITRNSSRLVDPRTGALRPEVPECGGSVTRNCVASYNIVANDPLRAGIDPAIQALNAKFPLPNTFSVGDGLNTGGYTWNPPSRFAGPHYMARIDHAFNDNNNLFVRYLGSEYDTSEGDLLNGRPSIFPGFAPLGTVDRSGKNLALSYRRVISPAMVNEFTAGISRFNFLFNLREANPEFQQVPPYGQECFGDDSFQLIDTPYCNTPHTQRAVTTFQIVDNLGYTRGAHSFRTGFNIRIYRHNDERGVPGGFNASPTIIFNRLRRSPLNENPAWVLPATASINATDRNNLQNAIVSLAGIVGRVQQAFQADLANDAYTPDLFRLGTRTKQFNLYFQDEWRLRSNLTMTYGVRWELNLPPSDGAGRVFVPDKAVDGSQGPVRFVKADRWFDRMNALALAPRVGIAWSPDAKTAFRLGYGVAFDTISSFQVTSVGGKVPGSFLQCRVNVQDSAAGSAPCADLPNDVRLSQLLRQVNPFMLPIPDAKPSTELAPPNRVLTVAPNVGAFDPNLKIPTVHEWSLTIQREFPRSLVGQVGYIGKRGMRLYRAYDLNQIATDQPGFLDSFLAAQRNLRGGCRPDGTDCPAGMTGVPPTLLLAMVPASVLNGWTSEISQNGLGEVARLIDQRDIVSRGFPANYFRRNAQFSELFYFDSGGSSVYHGVIAQIRRRFAQGLELGASYTFSKSIDDMSVDPVAATSGGALSSTNSRTPTDVRNFRLDRALSDFDNTHVLVANGVFELPFGRGRSWAGSVPRWADHIVGGWTLTGIFTYQSGEPYTINSGIRTANGYKVSRADLLGSMPDGSLKFVNGIEGPVAFNVGDIDAGNCRQVVGSQSSFCIPAPGGHGMGRNVVRGPMFWNLDSGVSKNFTVTDRVRLQFRGEFFNVFNHPNFDNPRNASEGSPTLTSSLFGQTCCVTAALPSSATIIANGEPNRVIQFALKLQF
ncbi:MAG: TonB-dependent receptor [Acidobacteria bacterium]|nr:TonB-dependent receptor [Acidobacteriota bacterium]MBI3279900.1 TonB-dependent receptor [Acidobacteriota bacterium]